MKMHSIVLLSLIALIGNSFRAGAQCSPEIPPTNPSYSMGGRTITVSNVNIDGAGNYLTVAPGATFNISFNWSIGPDITACPGCVTFYHFGLSNVNVPGSGSTTTYPNTYCMGSISPNQSSSSSGSFTAPTEDGYYYITLVSKWVFWCHQYPVNHCTSRTIGLIKVGDPGTLAVALDSLNHLTGCETNDGSIGISVTDYVGCFTTAWTGPGGFTANNQTVLTDLAAGDYQVVVSDISGCDTTLNFTINDVLQDEVDLGSDTILCIGQTLLLEADYPGATYLWQDGSSGSSFTVAQSGIYWVEVTSGNCSTRDSILVDYLDLIVDLGVDTTVCNSSYVLNPDIDNAAYAWQNGSTGATFTVTASGIYWVDVTIGNCTLRDSIAVTVDPAFSVDLGGDQSICGDREVLDATTAGASYTWQDGSNISTYTALTDGVYWVDVTVGSCTIRDSATLDFTLPFAIDLGPDTVLCDGSLLLDATTPGGSYTWQDGSQNPTFTVNATGSYSVAVSVAGSCPDQTDTIEVSYAEPVAFNGLDDVAICRGEAFDPLVSEPGASVLWSDGSTESSPSFYSEGEYWVEVSNGCETVRDTFSISLSLCGCRVVVPSAFTPNGDGINDRFLLFPQCDINQFRVRIYNRWGEPVFASSDPGYGWDGTFKGKEVEMDSYSWVIDYTVPVNTGGEEQVRQQGTVQVLR